MENINKEELLAQAKLKYPVGTKFYPAHVPKSDLYCIITNHNFKYDSNNIIALTNKNNIWNSNGEPNHDNGTSYNRLIYYGGKWAEIISKPEEEFVLPEKWYVKPKTEENLLKIKNYFKSFDNYKISNKNNSYTFERKYHTNDVYIKDSHKEITFEQFQKYVLKDSQNTVKTEEPPKIDLSNLEIGQIYHGKHSNQVWEYIVKVINPNSIGHGNKAIYVHENRYNSDFGYMTPDSNWEFVKLAGEDEKHWLNACISAKKFIPKEEALKTGEFKVGDWVKILDCATSSYKSDIGKVFQITTCQGDDGKLSNGYRFTPSNKELYKFLILATPEEIAKVTGKKEEKLLRGEKLLLEAKQKYPVGTIIEKIGANAGGKFGYEIRFTNHQYYSDTDQLFVDGNTLIYCKGEWAKIKEQPMNTYGLKVGDVIKDPILNAWLQNGENAYGSDKRKAWLKTNIHFGRTDNRERAILKFEYKEGVVGMNLSDCADYFWIRVEGFKEFMDNFDKPKQEVDNPKYEVVHCKNQQEWDFAISKCSPVSIIFSESKKFIRYAQEYSEGIAVCTKENSYCGLDYWKRNKAKIYSFEEWCTKFNYKPDFMKSNELKSMKIKSLVGRYLKALVDNPNSGLVKAGEIGIVTEEKDGIPNYVNFPSQNSYAICEYTYNEGNSYQLMPEGFTPEKDKEEVPEYVECYHLDKNGSNTNFTIGKIYKITDGSPIDDSNTFRVNIKVIDWKHWFKPSTKEAYESQFKPKDWEPKIGNWVVWKGDSPSKAYKLIHFNPNTKGFKVEHITGDYSSVNIFEICRKAEPHEIPKDKSEVKDMFKKGDYIVQLFPTHSYDQSFQQYFCFKQRNDGTYLTPEDDGKGSKANGWAIIEFKNPSTWRYATHKEMINYDRIGKPFDVRTLEDKKDSTSNSLESRIKGSIFEDITHDMVRMYPLTYDDVFPKGTKKDKVKIEVPLIPVKQLKVF